MSPRSRRSASVKQGSLAGRHRKTRFRNGLTVVSERKRGFNGISMGIWIKTGSRYEERRVAGISHFIEHMLFKGTENRSAFELVQEIEQVGGDFNAYTDREYTCFYVITLRQDLAKGAEILADILLNSTFDPEELERERKVILQEISMVEESPDELAFDLFFEKIYGRHGLGRKILGTENSIRKMRRADLLRYFRRHYRPDQIVVSVVGDVSHQAILKSFKQLSKREWPGRPLKRATRKERGFEPAPKIKGGLWWIKRSTEQAHLIWGVEGPRFNSRDRYASLLLDIHMGGGMSSLLFQEIREKRALAYSVYSTVTPLFDSGIFSIYVGSSLSRISTCLKVIEDCVGRMRRSLISEEELELAKNTLKSSVLLSADDVDSRMSSLAKYEMFFQRYMATDQICTNIDQVRPQDIRRVARRIFGLNRKRSVLVLGPRPTRRMLKLIRQIVGGAK